MASWEEVQDFIEEEYSAEKRDDNIWIAHFHLGEERSQMVTFSKRVDDKSNVIWLDIQSPIGKISSREKLDTALSLMAKMKCGGLIMLGDIYLVRHGIPIDDLSVDEIEIPMATVCSSADVLEGELVGGDNW